MAITEPAQFATEKMQKAYAPIVFVEVDGISQYWASRFIDISADTATPANWPADFDDVFTDVSGVNITVDREGGFATIGNIALDLTNFGYDTFLNSNPYPENEEVIIYLIFDDGTKLVYTEKLQIFTGRIQELGIDYDNLSLSVSHKTPFENKQIGSLIDSTAYPVATNDALGEMFPILYGDFYYPLNATAASVADLTPTMTMSRCIFLSQEGNTYTYIVSGHSLRSMATDNFWIYDNKTNRFQWVESSQITVTNTDGNGNAIVELRPDDGTNAGNLKTYDFWFGEGETTKLSGASNWGNPANSNDRKINSTADINTLGWSGNKVEYRMDFPAYDNPDYSSIDEVQYYIRANYDYNGGDDTNVAFVVGNQSQKANTTAALNTYVTAAAVDANPTFYIEDTNPGTVNSQIIASVYELYKRFEVAYDGFDQTRFSTLYFDGEGYLDSVDGGVLDNPATIIKHIAENHIGFQGTGINSSSFSSARSNRSSWVFRFALYNQQNGLDLLGDLARYSHQYLYFNNANELKIRTYQDNPSFVTATGATPANDDIWAESPNSSGGKYTQHYIDGQNIPITKTPLNEFANDITVNYTQNYKTNAFQVATAASSSTSISNYGKTYTKTINHPYMVGTSTANTFISNELNIRKERQYRARIPSDLSAANIELADVINLRTTELYNILGTATTESAKWQITGIRQQLLTNPGKIELTAWKRN